MLTTGAALCVKASMSKVAWWCSSHVWRGLSLCQFRSS